MYSAQHRRRARHHGDATRRTISSIRSLSRRRTRLFCSLPISKEYELKGYQVPEFSRTARGIAIVNLLRLDPDEKYVPFASIHTIRQSRHGDCRRTRQEDIALRLQEHTQGQRSRLRCVKETGSSMSGCRTMTISCSSRAMTLIVTMCMRATGNTMGVNGIKLSDDDQVISDRRTATGRSSFTENRFGKRTSLSEYRVRNRHGGLITLQTTKRTEQSVSLK